MLALVLFRADRAARRTSARVAETRASRTSADKVARAEWPSGSPGAGGVHAVVSIAASTANLLAGAAAGARR